MKHFLILISFLLLSSPLFGQSKPKYKSTSQCIQQTMMETKLTGNKMFEFVKKKCDGYLEKVEGKVEKIQNGVLFHRKVNNKWGWFEIGDEKKDEKYVGEVENGKPNGHGKLTSPEGEDLYLGKYKDGKKTIGYGIFIHWGGNKYFGELKNGIPNGHGILNWGGEKIFGEFRNGEVWKGTTYNIYGIINGKYVNGRLRIQ